MIKHVHTILTDKRLKAKIYFFKITKFNSKQQTKITVNG